MDFSIGKQFLIHYIPQTLHEPPVLLLNFAAVAARCKELQLDPRFPKNNYNYVLTTLNTQKIHQNSPKNSQTSQESLSFRTNASSHSKIPQIPSELPEKTILPLKPSRAKSFYPELHFHDSCAKTLRISSFYLFLHPFITIVCCLYLFVYCVLALGNSMPETPFEDFQEQAFQDSEVLFSGQQGKCP
jgi:hypothetical protein